MFWRQQFCLQTSASEVIVMSETSNQAAREYALREGSKGHFENSPTS